ncbi:helix-turn-helix transcriptional regulator [bacterium]|nr:helix-turn-helix transcriptional regulator [bacterium]
MKRKIKSKVDPILKRRGIYLTDIARKLGIPYTSLVSMVEGKLDVPRKVMIGLSKYLDVDVEFLWSDQDPFSEIRLPKFSDNQLTRIRA